ncbi:MAG TPA: ATP-binding protein [Pyrinomonadaceae bacterium]|nr:ATP-binding protein [Pyrinomonadaceae bacterium]
MKGSLLTSRTWLLLITAALLIAAGVLNFSQRLRFQPPPTDGVTWVDTAQGVVAKTVQPGSAAARARIISGDRLLAVSMTGRKCNDVTRGPRCEQVATATGVQMYLDQARVGGEIHYLIERPSYPEETRIYYADLDNLGAIQNWTARDAYINLIGLVYLCVGLFVVFKQGGRAPFVLHFATLSLAAFVFQFYTPIGTYRDLDLAIAFLRSAGFIMFAPLFLHFSAIYPVRYHLFEERRWRSVLLYVPALLLLGVATIVFLRDQLIRVLPFASSLLKYSPEFAVRFYKAAFLQFAIALLISLALLIRRFLISKSTVAHQQLKWVVWGVVLATVPFILFYATGYILGADTAGSLTDVAVLPLILIPLALGYSVVRYRLMDVELVVRRAAVYALTTLAIAVALGAIVYFVGYAFSGNVVSSGEIITLPLILSVAAMACIVMIAAPVKNFLQERVDRIFYGQRYDLRRSLSDFGRTVSATTALDPLLDSLITRLREVMNVERLAIFIEDERAPAGYRVARTAGLSSPMNVPADFREMIRVRSAETGVVRADDLESGPEGNGFVRRVLHYYVPCVVRGRMVAVIGLGRSADGALLSSEDVEILRTVSGYVAVAIENSLLYQKQQQHAAELELLKEFNESIVESINVGLLAVDLDGRITRLNSALEEIFSLGRDEAIGEKVEDLFVEDFADTLQQVLGPDGWQLSQTRQIYKLHTATRAGRSLVLNIALAPLCADTREQTGALVVFEDVTERLQLEEQLQQREKLSSIGLLAAGVAHEVNTPLTGISSYTQMLLGMLPKNDPKHALLEKVSRQADRASEIVNNLLNFSRTGSAAEFAGLDIHRVLDDTLQLLEPQLRRSQIEIVRDYGDNLPRVHGNSVKLQQVFTNLILNARDSIANGNGRITLATRNGEDDGLLVVEVADTGVGIAPEDVANIYDPFFTTKGVGRGTGLGLAVTYGIVQEHDGHISVSSTPGRGTTFRITLPTNDPRPRLQAAAR